MGKFLGKCVAGQLGDCPGSPACICRGRMAAVAQLSHCCQAPSVVGPACFQGSLLAAQQHMFPHMFPIDFDARPKHLRSAKSSKASRNGDDRHTVRLGAVEFTCPAPLLPGALIMIRFIYAVFRTNLPWKTSICNPATQCSNLLPPSCAPNHSWEFFQRVALVNKRF